MPHHNMEAIITVMATFCGRKRRQVHYRLYPQLAICDKNDEHVAPCWKTGGETLTGKTTIRREKERKKEKKKKKAAVVCNVLLFVVL